MTAREDEPEPVVFHVALRLGRLGALVEQRGLGVAIMARCLTTQAVDGAVAGGGGDPAARIGRQSGRRPRSLATRNASWTISSAMSISPKRRTKVATTRPDSSRKIRSRSVAAPERAIGAGTFGTGFGPLRPRARLGTDGPRRAPCTADPLAAHASAASRSGAVMIQNPPSCSLVSANGPSVMIGSPSVPHDRCDLRRMEAAAEDPGAGGLELLVERVDLLERLLHHCGIGRHRGLGAVPYGQEVLRHGDGPFG